MAETKPVKVTRGVYGALREISEREDADMSTLASLMISLFLLGTDAVKDLPGHIQADLAGDLFQFMADVAREDAHLQRMEVMKWKDLRSAFNAWKHERT